jgi:hypothetical protein
VLCGYTACEACGEVSAAKRQAVTLAWQKSWDLGISRSRVRAQISTFQTSRSIEAQNV